jgi:hypothetical protein
LTVESDDKFIEDLSCLSRGNGATVQVITSIKDIKDFSNVSYDLTILTRISQIEAKISESLCLKYDIIQSV